MRVDAPPEPGGAPHLTRRLTLFDSVMLVVSGTIGASIFITPADVLRAVPDPQFALLLWVIAGAVTLLAGLACAELGGMFPEAGGQYVFIREAYGGFPAFLYGWVLFTAGNSGALAAIAITFALFLGQAFPALAADHVLATVWLFGTPFKLEQGAVIAIVAVVLLTAINMRSVKLAARLQNLTAVAYLAAVAGIVVFGFLLGHGDWAHFVAAAHAPGAAGAGGAAAVAGAAALGVAPMGAAKAGVAGITLRGAGIAMIALLWSYDGWEFLSWVAGEIKNPRRNLPLALIIGILLVIATYLLVNAVFIYALSPAQLTASAAPADSVMRALFSGNVGRWVALFIALISFGSASVVVLGGARIYYSMARDGVFFPSMTRVHPRWHTPVTSLLAQCVWVISLIVTSRYDQLYTCFVFMMTLTYVLTVGAVFVLRRTQPERPRPYRCAGYPWLPALYLFVACGFVISTLLAKPRESLIGVGMALAGIPLYVYWRKTAAQGGTVAADAPPAAR
jgi:APA family basic amino acid/polyamine antiporter